MKKLLIAAAAMSVVAGAAQAQSSVTIYGTVDAGYGSFSTENTGAAKITQKGIQYNAHDTSRIGFKAVEDIGGGVKAGMTLESALNQNPGRANGYKSDASAASDNTKFSASGVGNTIDATRLGDRIATVDLTMGAHTINAGYQAQPTRAVAVAFQAENSNLVGNLVGNDSFLTGRVTAINYTFNAGNGLNVGGAVMENTKQKDGANDSKTSNGYALHSRYTAGAFDGGLVYTEQKTNDACVADTLTVKTQLGSPTCQINAAGKDQKTKALLVAASYDLGAVRLFAEHADIKIDDSIAASPTNDSKRHATSLGLRVPLTAKAWVGGQYSMGKAKLPSATYEGDWTGYSVTARYNFSNRTAAYAGVGEAKLDYDATHTSKATQYAVGLIHNF